MKMSTKYLPNIYQNIYQNILAVKGTFEDTTCVIRSRTSKDRQYNGQSEVVNRRKTDNTMAKSEAVNRRRTDNTIANQKP